MNPRAPTTSVSNVVRVGLVVLSIWLEPVAERPRETIPGLALSTDPT